MKSLILHVHGGPNPWKVALVLEELSVPYETKVWLTPDQKKPPFTTKLNPNGFTPVLEDPNNNLIIWESGAIIEYLLETYDTKNLISFPSSSPKERAHLRQYLFFQCTFQGPNLSSALYFKRNIPIPAARQRFVDESIRVLKVLESALQASGDTKEWLVGGRLTVADLVFMPYMWSFELTLGDDKPNVAEEFPLVSAWMQRTNARETVQKVAKARASAAAVAAAALAAANAGAAPAPPAQGVQK